VFVGTHGDRTVRAFAKDTGRIVWEHQLPAHPEGMPAVYEVGGRQHVAFFASTPQGGREASAQGYYVFALPERIAPASRPHASGGRIGE
jgi:quinoprotein glucose dehydrogenase